MRKTPLIFALIALLIVEIIQTIFVYHFLNWFEEKGISFLYHVLFSFSLGFLIALGYFLTRGSWYTVLYKIKYLFKS